MASANKYLSEHRVYIPNERIMSKYTCFESVCIHTRHAKHINEHMRWCDVWWSVVVCIFVFVFFICNLGFGQPRMRMTCSICTNIKVVWRWLWYLGLPAEHKYLFVMNHCTHTHKHTSIDLMGFDFMCIYSCVRDALFGWLSLSALHCVYWQGKILHDNMYLVNQYFHVYTQLSHTWTKSVYIYKSIKQNKNTENTGRMGNDKQMGIIKNIKHGALYLPKLPSWMDYFYKCFFSYCVYNVFLWVYCARALAVVYQYAIRTRVVWYAQPVAVFFYLGSNIVLLSNARKDAMWL